jgi:negative regulator of sigma E activity
LAVDPALAEQNYEAREVGEEEVAGRVARQLAISPRGGGPVVLRLWLDKENSFALRRERYNVEGRRISGTEYTDVEFGPKVAADVFEVPKGWTLVPSADLGRKLSLSELSVQLGYPVAAPEYVPQGYVLLGGYQQEWGRRQMRTAELRYTDGLRLLSVFQHPAPENVGKRPDRREGGGRHGGGWRGGLGHDRGRPGPPRPGETTFLDRGTEKVLRYFGRGRAVIAIGDVSTDDLIRVAKSVPQD